MMRPSDRPVIAEPEERPAPAPFRVRLGDVVHLNGAIPRGADLRNATPKRCVLCGALFIFLGKGSGLVKFCEACRAQQKCRTCSRPGGSHSASCPIGKPRPCRGCGVELGRGDGATRRQFCEPCWERECPECGVRGGRHQRICLYDTHQRRPGLTERHEIVTVEDILPVYLAHRAVAIRRARRICGAEAEDVVHDVIAYLLGKRAYLRRFDAGYFYRAVRHAALRSRLYAWSRYVVAMDPFALLLAEQAMVGARRGRHSESEPVRLPEAEPERDSIGGIVPRRSHQPPRNPA
jgi:hypothetical protein